MTQQYSEPLVSIICINYKNSSVTCELLQTIALLSFKNLEIIIVDNESIIDVSNQFLSIIPEVIYVRSEKNLGFAGGNNLGISRAIGEFLFFVNNDTELTPNCIQPLVGLLKRNSTIGMVSPQINFYFDKQIIQYAGFTDINAYTGRNVSIGYLEKDKGQYNIAKPTSFAHGAAMMIPKQAIQKVGLMPELYFLYYEELDWCCKFKNAGFQIYFEPNSLVYHKESVSVGNFSPLKVFYNTRNRIIFMRRNVSKVKYYIFIIFYHIFVIPKTLFNFLINKNFALITPFLKGYLKGLAFTSIN